jgi:hypothetical protein
MGPRSLSLATGALAIMASIAFLGLAVSADHAIGGKSGLGDPIQFAQLNTYAGVSFYLAILAWLTCVVCSQFAPQPYRGRALFGFGLMVPILNFIGWLLGTIGA